MAKPTRNYGVDLLRIFCILGVVCLHLLGLGGILDGAQSHGQNLVLWSLEALAMPAVNCFVLISGFFGFRENRYYPKLKNILSLTFTAIFYCLGICLLFKLLAPGAVSTKQILSACVPFKHYWFFAAYFGMFLLSPILNFFIHKADSRLHFIFLLALTLFSCVSLVMDAFSLARGYSMIWFVLLYTTGGLIKKYNLPGRFSKKVWLLVILGAYLVTWLPIAILPLLKISLLTNYSTIFASYISPTMVLMAIGWLCLFSKVTVKKQGIPMVALVTPSVFSVYLIHENPFIRQAFMSEFHFLCDGLNVIVTLGLVIVFGIAIFLLCLLIDLLRRYLFRVARLDNLAEKLAAWIKNAVLWLYRKLPFEAK